MAKVPDFTVISRSLGASLWLLWLSRGRSLNNNLPVQINLHFGNCIFDCLTENKLTNHYEFDEQPRIQVLNHHSSSEPYPQPPGWWSLRISADCFSVTPVHHEWSTANEWLQTRTQTNNGQSLDCAWNIVKWQTEYFFPAVKCPLEIHSQWIQGSYQQSVAEAAKVGVLRTLLSYTPAQSDELHNSVPSRNTATSLFH